MSTLENSISHDKFSSILDGVKKQTNIEETSESITDLASASLSTISSSVAKNASVNVANIEPLTSLSDKFDDGDISDVGPVRLKNPLEGFFSTLLSWSS